MARHRSPEHDYVCRKCGVACDISGDRHYRGGRSPRACKSAEPMLRREYEAWMDQMAKDAADAVRMHRRGY